MSLSSTELTTLADHILSGADITRDEALSLEDIDPLELFPHANRIRKRFRGDRADLCAIVSAKTGACPEDCSYCAQSARAKTGVETFPLVEPSYVAERAKLARQSGAGRFCIVTSGKRATVEELGRIMAMVSEVRALGLKPCATLGLLAEEELTMLRNAGLYRYHHNLETSRRFFPEICSTHTYDQKLQTIRAAKAAGLSVCSGGIFGIGEAWEDRVDMALELRGLDVDSVPVNFLVPVAGTPLGETEPLRPFEALKIVSLFRFMLPNKEIRICGGRLQTLGEFNSLSFMAGADGLLTGDCLTVAGRDTAADLRLAREYGLEV